MKSVLIASLILISSNVMAKTIPVRIEANRHSVTAHMQQSVKPDQVNVVEKFFNDLNAPVDISEAGARTKKYISADKNLEIKCSEVQIPEDHFFICRIKANLTATATYSPIHVPNSGLIFSAKAEFATELNNLLGGHPVRCVDYEYGENFITNLCPQYVVVRIYAKRNAE